MFLQSQISPIITDLHNQIPFFCNWYSDSFYFYHENLADKDNLLITVGDSWTWGDGLADRQSRTDHIYGKHLADMLNYDFVNIAVCGVSNIVITDLLIKFINSLTKQYKKIQVVITLTESGRDLQQLVNFNRSYTAISEPNWPTLDQLTNNADFKQHNIVVECRQQCNMLSQYFDNETMLALCQLLPILSQSTNLHNFLENYDSFTLDYIDTKFKQLPSTMNISYILARNFTRSFTKNKNRLIDKIWTDVIASCGNLNSYPDHVYLMTSAGIDPIRECITQLNLSFDKSDMLKLFDVSLQAISWLEKSPYNSNIATKHPNEQAHQWWAKYLYDYVN